MQCDRILVKLGTIVGSLPPGEVVVMYTGDLYFTSLGVMSIAPDGMIVIVGGAVVDNDEELIHGTVHLTEDSVVVAVGTGGNRIGIGEVVALFIHGGATRAGLVDFQGPPALPVVEISVVTTFAGGTD